MRNHEYYDRLAETRWGRYITDFERRAILASHEMCDAPSIALDIGASGGRWSEFLSTLGWRMICTDVDPTSLDQCRIRLPQASCILVDHDDTALPCEKESVGLILCVEVFSVMPTDWFAAEAFRVLQPNGLIVGVFNNKLSWRGYLHHLTHSYRGVFDYYGNSYLHWKRRFQQIGFNIKYEEGLCWLPFSRNSDFAFLDFLTSLEYKTGLQSLPALSPWIVFIAQNSDYEHLRQVRV